MADDLTAGTQLSTEPSSAGSTDSGIQTSLYGSSSESDRVNRQFSDMSVVNDEQVSPPPPPPPPKDYHPPPLHPRTADYVPVERTHQQSYCGASGPYAPPCQLHSSYYPPLHPGMMMSEVQEAQPMLRGIGGCMVHSYHAGGLQPNFAPSVDSTLIDSGDEFVPPLPARNYDLSRSEDAFNNYQQSSGRCENGASLQSSGYAASGQFDNGFNLQSPSSSSHFDSGLSRNFQSTSAQCDNGFSLLSSGYAASTRCDSTLNGEDGVNNDDEQTHMSWDEVIREAKALGIPLSRPADSMSGSIQDQDSLDGTLEGPDASRSSAGGCDRMSVSAVLGGTEEFVEPVPAVTSPSKTTGSPFRDRFRIQNLFSRKSHNRKSSVDATDDVRPNRPGTRQITRHVSTTAVDVQRRNLPPVPAGGMSESSCAAHCSTGGSEINSSSEVLLTQVSCHHFVPFLSPV